MNSLPANAILNGKSHRYVIRKKLGQGTFGITYLAEILPHNGINVSGLSIRVAIKEFFMRSLNGRKGCNVTIENNKGLFSDYKNKFLREARNLSKMTHENIVDVLEVFEQNNTVYYSMEFIDGGSLDEYIAAKGRLPENEAVWAIKEIGKAVEYMHSMKMLHLDIKPLNVMRRNNGSLLLIDFGLSKLYDKGGDSQSTTSVGAGTPGYAPLEQENYSGGYDFPASMDVYALGGTLYKMLVGERPPVASDILNNGFPMGKLSSLHVSDTIKRTLEVTMSPVVRNRPQTVSAFLRLLPKVNERKLAEEKLAVAEIVDDHQEDSATIIRPQMKYGIMKLPKNIKRISFKYSNLCAPKHGVASCSIEIMPKLMRVFYVTGKGVENRQSYYLSAEAFGRLLEEINSLQLKVEEVKTTVDPIVQHVELTSFDDIMCYSYFDDAGEDQSLKEKTEKICLIMGNLAHIDGLNNDANLLRRVFSGSLFRKKKGPSK